MKILIKNAKIVAPGQARNGWAGDLFVVDGLIEQMSESIENEADQVVLADNLYLSPGWMDSFAHFCDPGYEFKESLETGARAAAAGGFTEVMVLPDTRPCVDSRSQVEYIVRRSEGLPVSIHPIGAISSHLAGESLAEMYDMYQGGAKAFSDGLHPVQMAGLLLKAMQYVKAFKGIIIQIPDDKSISEQGLVHEGLWSTRLGISGIPDIAEEMFVKRDLDILRYTESRLHITGLSLSQSVSLIEKAKKEGLAVSCSVTPYHLMLTDEKLNAFDSNYKVNPPLREQEDLAALRSGLEKGIIDCLASHHFPQDLDSKDKEFEYASGGMIGLETAFGLLGKALPDLDVVKKVEILAGRSRRVFDLPVPEIEVGKKASLTLFDPDKIWNYQAKNSLSKSRNTPFDGVEMKGRVLGTIHNNQIFLNH